jgi:hypothetical protein
MNCFIRVSTGIALLVFGLLLPGQSSALTMDETGFFESPTFVDFESDLPSGLFASHTTDDAVFSSGSGYSTLFVMDFYSGESLIAITGSLSVDFTTEVTRVGFDYWARTPIYLEAYDAAGNLLNPGDTGGVTGRGFLGFESIDAPIASVVIHDQGLTFRVDSFGYDASSDGSLNPSISPVPEPSGALLFSVGMVGSFAAIRRRHTRH